MTVRFGTASLVVNESLRKEPNTPSREEAVSRAKEDPEVKALADQLDDRFTLVYNGKASATERPVEDVSIYLDLEPRYAAYANPNLIWWRASSGDSPAPSLLKDASLPEAAERLPAPQLQWLNALKEALTIQEQLRAENSGQLPPVVTKDQRYQ